MASKEELAEARRKAIDRLTEDFRRRLESQLDISPHTLDEIEHQAYDIGKETVESVRKEIVKKQGDGHKGSKASCSCGSPARFVGRRKRQIVTMSGVHLLARACYHCQRCRRIFSPLDRQLDLLDQGCSRWVMATSVRFCSFLPFQLAARELEAICDIRLAASTLERYCLHVGNNLKDDWSRKERLLWCNDVSMGAHRPKQLQLSMDGAIIFVGGEWREAKLGVVYERKGEHVEHARYYATMAKSSVFGRKMRTLAHEGGTGRCAKVGIVADGGAWIWQEAGKHFPQSVEILDYYHATEHLWQVANAQFGEGTSAAKEWMSLQEQALLDDRIADVIAAVATWKARKLMDQEIKRKVGAYLITHEHRMRYKTLKADGWHIGSGVMESGCKCVVKARMGGAGMRWSEKGAEAMLHISAHWRSYGGGDFHNYVN